MWTDTFNGKTSEIWRIGIVNDLSNKYESIKLAKYKSDFTAVKVRWGNGTTLKSYTTISFYME
jgi:hypothetical protein